MSASRADKSAKENRARAKQLDKDIRGRGFRWCYKSNWFIYGER